jgi:hypothetical protein
MPRFSIDNVVIYLESIEVEAENETDAKKIVEGLLSRDILHTNVGNITQNLLK